MGDRWCAVVNAVMKYMEFLLWPRRRSFLRTPLHGVLFGEYYKNMAVEGFRWQRVRDVTQRPTCVRACVLTARNFVKYLSERKLLGTEAAGRNRAHHS